MAAEPLIICEGLVKIYKVANLEVFALQGLDLVINRGELLAIVGASGSGKSTFMNILGGLDRPSAGRIVVDGIDLLKMSENELDHYRRSKVGFVWQQGARNLISYLTALENVSLPMTLSGSGGKDEIKRAEALLEVVGLTERKHHRLLEMSGGEQQRVAIAVALANNPRLLLADEPTGEVDSATAAGIFKVFQDLNRELGLTTVIVSHDAGIARHVQRVVAIRDGKTASETVRQSVAVAPQAGETHPEGHEHHQDVYEEVALLDSAGRLQIPREYLDKYQIKGRVQLEAVEGGVLVKPAPTNGQQAETPAQTETQPTAPVEVQPGLRSRLVRAARRILRRSI